MDLKTKKAKNDNTLKAEQKAHKAFTNFLSANGVNQDNLDYWNYSEVDLDRYLAKFWFGACKFGASESDQQDAEMTDKLYKANALCNF